MTVTLPADLPVTLPLLMAFDLDGTLIPDAGREVQPDAAQALARLRALGVKLAIITGRDTPPSPVLRVMEPDAVATNNGGRILIGEDLHTEARFSDADLDCFTRCVGDSAKAGDSGKIGQFGLGAITAPT